MFKKETKKENCNYVYTVYDKVSKRHIGLFYSTTDENMIRTSLPSILMDYPLRDIEIKRIGMFDDVNGTLDSRTSKIIPLDSYTFPHARLSSKGDDLSLDELDKGMKDAKTEQLKKIDKMREDYAKNKDSEKKVKEA